MKNFFSEFWRRRSQLSNGVSSMSFGQKLMILERFEVWKPKVTFCCFFALFCKKNNKKWKIMYKLRRLRPRADKYFPEELKLVRASIRELRSYSNNFANIKPSHHNPTHAMYICKWSYVRVIDRPVDIKICKLKYSH